MNSTSNKLSNTSARKISELQGLQASKRCSVPRHQSAVKLFQLLPTVPDLSLTHSSASFNNVANAGDGSRLWILVVGLFPRSRFIERFSTAKRTLALEETGPYELIALFS
ncbi:hypothetical protein PM082_015141 [Marasmius tenuissimus]|nr:hypothetical protein PM082_015141 [Marasmius tenuissimus]